MRSLFKRWADLGVTNTLLRELKADSSVRDDAAPYNARTMNINQQDCTPSLAAS